ncbi:8277_t:CDS:2, partial [Scutellospora calospora]
ELGHYFQIVDENSVALTNLLRLLNAIELCGTRLLCDRGIAYVFQTGVTPVAMFEFTSGDLEAIFYGHLHADIKPEFWVNSQNSHLGNKAIDLVKTSTRGRIAIEFDNIRMECINLNRTQKNEIVNLEISDPYRPNQKTVHEALEWKVKKKSNKYLEPLKKRHVYCFEGRFASSN